jgi:hypothetical protein
MYLFPDRVVVDSDSSYDTITRLTGFHAIDAAMEYAKEQGGENAKPMPVRRLPKRTGCGRRSPLIENSCPSLFNAI